MKKIRICLLALTMFPFLLSSCAEKQVIRAQQEQTEITLSWWGNDDRNEYTIEAVREFERLHPEIKVKCSYSEWSGYESRSRVQMVSATEADVMQINFSWLSQYSPDGKGYYNIEDLSDVIDLSNFSEEMLAYGRRGGILNAIPIAMNTETLYINKTLYQSYGLDVPQTWDDLFHAAAVMKKDDIYPFGAAAKSVWLYFITYAEQVSGKPFMKDDHSIGFSAAEFQLMVELYVRMIQEHVMPQVEYFERINIDNSIYGGTVAWVSDAENYLGNAMKNGNEVVVADYTAITPEQTGKGWYAKPATLYAVSVNTDHPTEAAQLLDFLLNSQEMALLQGIEKGIPLSASARSWLEEENMLNGLQYEASLCMEQTEGLSPMYPFMENTNMLNAFIDACNAVLYEKQTAEDAGKELYKMALSGLKG